MKTREQWLIDAVNLLKEDFKTIGKTVPAVRVSVGFPSKGGVARRKRTIGECWPRKASSDGVNQMFFNPTEADSIEVLGTLVHELIHAVDDCANGHKGPFKQMALAIGLEGKMTSTTTGPALKARFEEIVKELGEIPHAKLNASSRKKQGTRMKKIQCLDCETILYGSEKALENGLPTCACGGDFERM